MTHGKWIAQLAFLSLTGAALSQGVGRPIGPQIPLQPFADQVRNLESLLAYLGQPLSEVEKEGINDAFANSDPPRALERIESILDNHTLDVVTIGLDNRVIVTSGGAKADLIESGTVPFLVKIVNKAGVGAAIGVDSPEGNPSFGSVDWSSPNPPLPTLTQAEIRRRWMEVSILHDEAPAPQLPNDMDIGERIREKLAAAGDMSPTLPDLNIQGHPELSGVNIEYRILLIYARDAGQHSAALEYTVGQDNQRRVGSATVQFHVYPSPHIKLNVIDDDGRRTMASFIFRDGLGRLYPNPLKRLAPDLYFEPQVYRANGEFISLPPGGYSVTFTGGPEYITETEHIVVNKTKPTELTFHLKRWINPARYGWYSGDQHVHAAGCAYYSDPTPGVSPNTMVRQVLGEHLNVASILNWRPDYYYQRRYFNGQQDDAASRADAIIRYGIEVSGFPSSHSGHPILLNLKSVDYPGTTQIQEWPSWELPVFRWAKSQGATVGFAHIGGGLALGNTTLPNYDIPPFNAPGAVELPVDVTYPHAVDFLGVATGPSHTTLISGTRFLMPAFGSPLRGRRIFHVFTIPESVWDELMRKWMAPT